jgi:hypothetical protein
LFAVILLRDTIILPRQARDKHDEISRRWEKRRFVGQNPGRWTPVAGYETVGTLCEGSCEEHLNEMEWALSGMWGTGAFPQLRSAGKLWDGPKSKATLAKWISW